MRVKDFAEKIGMRILAGEAGLEKEITGMYACDLLSRVMSAPVKENGWITVHTHINVIAVALLAEISCVIIPEGISVEEATLAKAAEEGIPVLGTDLNTYEICWKAHEVLVRS